VERSTGFSAHVELYNSTAIIIGLHERSTCWR